MENRERQQVGSRPFVGVFKISTFSVDTVFFILPNSLLAELCGESATSLRPAIEESRPSQASEL